MTDNLKVSILAGASWWAYIDNVNVVLNVIIAVLSIVYTAQKIRDLHKSSKTKTKQ